MKYTILTGSGDDLVVAGQKAWPDPSYCHPRGLIVTVHEGGDKYRVYSWTRYDETRLPDGRIVSYREGWLPTDRVVTARRTTWGSYMSAFHGGGRLYVGHSWFAANRAAASARAEGCTCGCAGVIDISAEGAPAPAEPSDYPYRLAS